MSHNLIASVIGAYPFFHAGQLHIVNQKSYNCHLDIQF